MRFHIVGTQQVLISHSGLALAGALLQRTRIKRRYDRLKLGGGRPEISHGDNVLSMIGLSCMGKSDFEAINAFESESDEFFRLALGLGRVPSEPTLRQRLDAVGVWDVAATAPAELQVRTGHEMLRPPKTFAGIIPANSCLQRRTTNIGGYA